MNIEHLNNRNWYLAQYNTAGKNRESLFSWLNEQNVIPWTPLITRKIRRADAGCCFRKRVYAIFPGYFFVLVNFDIQPVSALRRHSAFIDFVKFGGEIKPVNKDIVDGLMKIYPDPVLNPGAREALNTASDIWLTKAQYQYLLRMENTLQPESRISLLLELVSNAEHHGFMEHLANIP
ncbi:TPA: transcription termination factor NusG [Escherichia coli]|nr:transcription termination factor NusG [Salmonella enterica subsp. enterica]EGM7029176.1 transcription termination factor NusG [Salmonella enterica subsp. enterica serovar Javiana]HAV9618971.1 transcription termination factor NusG [Escherichia coli]HAV9637072.1 transcription termination factor NusG [Escherichia coli]HAV9655585.1 transcription termination factor NusG [Escherichia coli]